MVRSVCSRFRLGACAALTLCALLTGCVDRTASLPPDLPSVKERLVAYYEQGEYARDLEAAASEARRYLASVVITPGERAALVLDVDDTALDTYAYQRGMGFGHYGPAWYAWIDEEHGVALAPVLDLYTAARAKGLAVFFITGRREKARAPTEAALRKAGYSDWEALLMKPDDWRQSARELKAPARQKLAESGWRIVLNVGDQDSDLAGGYAEKTVKLPNRIYRTE